MRDDIRKIRNALHRLEYIARLRGSVPLSDFGPEQRFIESKLDALEAAFADTAPPPPPFATE